MHNTILASTSVIKFSQIIYQRPEIDKFENKFFALLQEFENAPTFEFQNKILLDIYKLRDKFDTMYHFAYIKSHANTANTKFQEEIGFFDKVLPQVEKLVSKFYDALINATFKEQLSEKWGEHLFNLALNKTKKFHPSIMAELAVENQLKTKYTRLIGSINFEFDGQKHNLKSIDSCIENADRNIREKASHAKWAALSKIQDQLDSIFDEIVKVRHKMAKKLGYNNFTELGYVKMDRTNYDREMVADFRNHLLKHLGPIADKLVERQKKRLDYDNLYTFDRSMLFKTGNPTPKYQPEEILKRGKQMYADLSEETHNFFNTMLESGFMDVINRPEKSLSSYCSDLSQFGMPFIFASFNGTSDDIKILTHEAGHAFQYFTGKNKEITEYRWPTFDAAEVHSMSMEYLTYPWMKNFFEEDAEKYFFAHISAVISSMLSKCVGDHFQEIIYENPNMTADERAAVWKKMETKYMPSKTYLNNSYLENGRLWQVYWHIYNFPFYFIDYALAQICALQIWQKNKIDSTETWKDYMELCKAGGTLPFLEMIEKGNLKSPFEPGCIESIAKDLDDYLNNIDDSNF